MGAPKHPLNYHFAKPDPRDLKYSHHMRVEDHAAQVALPPSVDLRPNCPEIYDQGDQGSCTANAAGFVKQYLNMMYKVLWKPSIDFIYGNELRMQGTPHEDAGSDLRTSMQALLDYGACHENLYPYGAQVFKVKPSAAAFADGAKNKIGDFYAITSEYQLKHCLAMGYPAVCGIVVPKQMQEDDFGGVINSLQPTDAIIEDGQPAGHAVAIVGYDGDYYWFRNSWGSDWGIAGYWKMHKNIVNDPNWVTDIYTPRLAHQPGI